MDAIPIPDLGLGKPPGDARVVVAMSGGVDSSVVAALLVRAGYRVVGVTLQLYDHGAASGRAGACCAGRDVADARAVAERLDIPHYVLDYERRFRDAVIDGFADAYLAGETPVPCVACNERVKFRDLLGTARDLGADALATGHYVRRAEGPAGPELRRARDAAKDQSFFLFRTTADQLAFLRFPLGELEKAETRALARVLGLPVAGKPDSQDICFVPDGRYADMLERLRPGAGEAGEVVDLDGRVLGRHDGIWRFTIGQRRGLGLGGAGAGGVGGGVASEPLHVVRIEAAARRVVVGPRSALARRTVRLRDLNWLDDRPIGPDGRRVAAKLRSVQAPAPGRLAPAGDGEAAAVLTLDDAAFAPAPGQAAVLYDGDRLLGGGWIMADAPPPARPPAPGGPECRGQRTGSRGH